MSLSRVHRHLSLPTGNRMVHLNESLSRRRSTLKLEELFGRWGYVPVETPLVDYFEVYRRLLPEESTRATYRTVDRAGEMLMVRADTTLFVAKQLGIQVRAEELPIRVCYSEQILRHETEHDLSRNEYHQAGVELVGIEGADGDAEILLLLAEALQELNVTAAAIHVGSHAIVKALCRVGSGSARERDVAEALHLRDRDRFRSVLDLPDDLVDEIERVLFTIRDAREEQTPDRRDAFPEELTAALDDLDALTRRVSSLMPSMTFRVDPTEVGSHDYYTGTAFSVYAPDSGDAIARGGRYDDLLGFFGLDAPSVGFSIFTRKIASAPRSGGNARADHARGATLEERVVDARERRKRGEAVTL